MFLSSKFLKILGFDVLFNHNVIAIFGAQPLKIITDCNFFSNLHYYLFFFIAYPANSARMFKYISFCCVYLYFIQIIRISFLAICLKYFPSSWDFFHLNNIYIFYYPGIITLWYFYSSKPNVIKSKS